MYIHYCLSILFCTISFCTIFNVQCFLVCLQVHGVGLFDSYDEFGVCMRIRQPFKLPTDTQLSEHHQKLEPLVDRQFELKPMTWLSNVEDMKTVDSKSGQSWIHIFTFLKTLFQL